MASQVFHCTMDPSLRPDTLHSHVAANEIETTDVGRQSDTEAASAANNRGTHSTSQNSKLLGIAPEIRNAIYGYVLISEEDIEIPTSGKLNRPAILRVCQQISSEATTIYYGRNTFRSDVGDDYPGPIGWLRHQVPAQARSSIRSLTLHYDATTLVQRLLHVTFPDVSNPTAGDAGDVHQMKLRITPVTVDAVTSWLTCLEQLLLEGVQAAFLGFAIVIEDMQVGLGSGTWRDLWDRNLGIAMREAWKSSMEEWRAGLQHPEEEQWIRDMRQTLGIVVTEG